MVPTAELHPGTRRLLWAPRVSLLLLLLSLLNARAMETVKDAPELSCSQGLTDCQVSPARQFAPALPSLDDTTRVTQVQLRAVLCCSDAQGCEPCLQIILTIQEEDNATQVSEESGDQDELSAGQMGEGSGVFLPAEPRAQVRVCLSFQGVTEFCRTLHFKTSDSVSHQASQQVTHQLVLTENVTLGIMVVVHASSNQPTIIKSITVPSVEEVCSMNLEATLTQCDAPKLHMVPDQQRDVFLLQLHNATVREEEILYQMFWDERHGDVLEWPKGKTETAIPLNAVAPCLCYRAWWKGKYLRTHYCPFKKQNQQEALEGMRHNVSVSAAACPVREGGAALCWNVSAPCRLEAEVWLCKKDLAGGHCEEVTGFRRTRLDHVNTSWEQTGHGYLTFQTTGEFNVQPHPLLCVQMKILGKNPHLVLQCPFATSRWRWSLPLLVGLLLMCFAILGAYLVQGVLKGYVWRWLKEDDVKGAVGGGHVLLLYPSDDDRALPELMCHLGSSLQALGFSVSLDLWSKCELGALGPVPWLHSRLNRLQKHGGKVVLVLTQAAWIKAEEWGAGSWGRNRGEEEEETGRSCAASSPCMDVFTASLSCVLADYLQGRAGERFMLVQFESLPPEPPGGFRPLPELFRGLHVYSLPSQSLGFLTELAGARQTATASSRRKRAGGLRIASRTLARGLMGFTAGSTVLRLAGVPQSCVGTGGEDSGEMVPLQQSLVTPPSSPDSDPKASEMDWV